MTKYLDPQVTVPAIAAIIGVILGAVLGPLAKSFFTRREKTLRVRIFDKNPTMFFANRSDIRMTWGEDEIEKFVQLGFEITNTSRTPLRNFTLRFESGSYPPQLSDLFDFEFEDNPNIRWEELDCAEKLNGLSVAGIYRFSYFESKSTLRGSALTNGSNELRIIGVDGVELNTTFDSQTGGSLISRISVLLAATALSAAIGALSGH